MRAEDGDRVSPCIHALCPPRRGLVSHCIAILKVSPEVAPVALVAPVAPSTHHGRGRPCRSATR